MQSLFFTFALLRQAASILLFIFLAGSIFLRIGIVINWKINQDFIAENLCENKDKPRMCCKGKCQLKKQLQKMDTESQQENQSGEQKTSNSNIDLFCNVHKFEFARTNYKPTVALVYPVEQNHYDFCFFSKSIKPPILIVS